ncbi:MAG: hypothetical protein H0X26_08245 [Alphaproteobacteria bacterium]|nr:hypothetical protein [Alphaproteobacteria bacterium]
MYEAILQLVEGIINSPWEALGFATLLFHVEGGYILVKHILLPRYKYCRELLKSMQSVKDHFIQIDILHQEMKTTGKDADSLTESILRLNTNASLPLLKIRQIMNTANAHLFREKLYEKTVECSKILCRQHEYILLHNKYPNNLLSPKALENRIQELLDVLPRTFWESTAVYFKRIDLNVKRQKSSKKDFIDALYILGQAKKIKLFLCSKKLGSSSINSSINYFITEIKLSYIQKNEKRCKDLFAGMQSQL